MQKRNQAPKKEKNGATKSKDPTEEIIDLGSLVVWRKLKSAQERGYARYFYRGVKTIVGTKTTYVMKQPTLDEKGKRIDEPSS